MCPEEGLELFLFHFHVPSGMMAHSRNKIAGLLYQPC
jgi:hypothetical protein